MNFHLGIIGFSLLYSPLSLVTGIFMNIYFKRLCQTLLFSLFVLITFSVSANPKVLMETKMSAEDIAKKSIKVASEICVFTNNNITMEKI